MRDKARRLAALMALVCLGPAAAAAGPSPLPARRVTLDLPGPPAAIVPGDLDGDGDTDLALAIVYTEYDSIEFERGGGFIQITEIVPALFERREVRAYLHDADGSYRLAGTPAELPVSVLSLEPGPAGSPPVALTDAGVSLLRAASGPVFEPLLAEPPALAGAGIFLPGLGLTRDLDGAGGLDLLVPAREGPAVYLAREGGAAARAARLTLPGDDRGMRNGVWRKYPMPRAEDVDGDRLPDLVVEEREGDGDLSGVSVLRGAGGGRFAAPRRAALACTKWREEGESGDLVHFGDLDGDGRAEVVYRRDLETGDDDGLDEAREPKGLYLFHRLRKDFAVEPAPYQTLEVTGYGLGGTWPRFTGSEFRDLDGDGRKDLLTMTLDFSWMQVMRVLATKRFGMKLIFQPWAQRPDGSFAAAAAPDLSAKLLVDLDHLKLNKLALFEGDFDGDGSVDFVEFGHGREIRIRRGRPGCAYGGRADWELKLEEEPLDASLVRVADLDGDRRSDLWVTRPLPVDTQGATVPVRLDFYLSRGAR